MHYRSVTRLVIGLFLASMAWGQGLSSINGTVTDPLGALIPGARVTVTEVETTVARTTISNADGLYGFTALRPTKYTLSVESAGFRTFTQTGITLQADETVTVNFKLELGSTTDSVTVEAAASQIDTTTATLRQVVDSARINELPLNGRNVAQLTSLVAGAVLSPPDATDEGATKTFPVVVTVSTNGARSNQTSFVLDGVPNIDLISKANLPFPMPDALQEFGFQTSNYGAEYGQNAGGVVNIVTKSGTNAFHGNAFEYIRNAEFNARNFFEVQRDPLKRNQYGGTLGGPVIRDKFFFFFGYQDTRIRSVQGGLSSYVPTPANLTGDFSALLSATNPNNPQQRAIALKDPTTNAPFPGNIIPVGRFDPASLALQKTWLPVPSTGSGLSYYNKPIAQDFGEYTAKGDYVFSSNDRLSVRYFRDHFNTPAQLVPGNLLTYGDYSDFVVQSPALQETHIFTANLLNEFRFGSSYESDRRGPPTNAPSVKQFGVNIQQGSVNAIEGISVTSYFSTGTFPPGKFPRVGFNWNDSLRWIKGRHTFTVGGSFERARLNEYTETNSNATFTFSGDTTGAALSDFMLGKLRTFTQGNGTVQTNRLNLFYVFAQDTFKVSSRLTLNFGIRWEPSFPWHDVYQEAEVFFPDRYAKGLVSTRYPNALPGEFFGGDSGIPQDGRKGDWNNIAPRIGFAYDVFGNGKTSIRGGAGEFFDVRVPGFANNRQSQATPFTLLVTFTTPQGPFSNPYLGQTNPFPAPLPPGKDTVFPRPVTVYSRDPSLQLVTPTIYNGNLTIEHQLATNWLMRVGYVGSRTLHLNTNKDLNPGIYVPVNSPAIDARRLYPGYGQIKMGSNVGNAWYHSLQMTLEKRLSKGFTVQANYTFSKSLDGIPLGTDVVDPTTAGYYVMPSNINGFEKLDLGPSDFDRRHVLSISYVWRLPTLEHQNGFVRGVAGGWGINGIISAQSGGPVTPTAGSDRSMSGEGNDRANLVNSDGIYTSGPCANIAPCVNYMNAANFAIPALGSFGNVGKGLLRGPGQSNWDLSASKAFQIKERYSLQLHVQFFNVLNHTRLGGPSSSLSGTGFGQIRSAGDPRIGQMALKFTF